MSVAPAGKLHIHWARWLAVYMPVSGATDIAAAWLLINSKPESVSSMFDFWRAAPLNGIGSGLGRGTLASLTIHLASASAGKSESSLAEAVTPTRAGIT